MSTSAANTKYLCVPCLRTQFGDDTCERCNATLDRGSLCIGCAMDKASHDDFCLHCLAVQVIERTITIEELPIQWQREVSDEVACEVAYRESQRLARVQKARQEFMDMIAMVARSPVECGVQRKAS